MHPWVVGVQGPEVCLGLKRITVPSQVRSVSQKEEIPHKDFTNFMEGIDGLVIGCIVVTIATMGGAGAPKRCVCGRLCRTFLYRAFGIYWWRFPRFVALVAGLPADCWPARIPNSPSQLDPRPR